MSGNKAETATLLPVIQAFQARHGTVDFRRRGRRRDALGGQPQSGSSEFAV
jgi:hypothetical protein